MRFNCIKDVKEFLAQIPKFANSTENIASYDLENIKTFCSELGNPQNKLRAIHVAGTNGKGSTCRLLSSMYQSAGYRVGLYTSPHLISYNDRFLINSEPAKDEELVLFFKKYGNQIKELSLSFFEISTAFAFWFFHKQWVDIAIIETGLGGRLDATNIIHPELCIITTISRDHENILGIGLKKIAREKAGIIKKNTPVVIGNLPSKAETVIKKYAKRQNSRLYNFCDYKITTDNQLLIERNEHEEYLPYHFLTSVQALNIAIAYRAVQILKNNTSLEIPFCAIKDGLVHLNKRFPHTGCFQKLSSKLAWYYDGAHNLQAFEYAKDALTQIESVEDTILVIALMEDKINRDLLNQFSDFKKIYYYKLSSHRSAPYQRVVEVLPQTIELSCTNPKKENEIISHLKSQLVLFTGSLYFYNTVRRWVNKVTF